MPSIEAGAVARLIAAVVATLTLSFHDSPLISASTYALLAAWLDSTGVGTTAVAPPEKVMSPVTVSPVTLTYVAFRRGVRSPAETAAVPTTRP